MSSKIKLIEEIDIMEYIKNNLDKINWDNVAMYQKLPIEFIEEHYDDAKWNWNDIKMYQDLPDDFL